MKYTLLLKFLFTTLMEKGRIPFKSDETLPHDYHETTTGPDFNYV